MHVHALNVNRFGTVEISRTFCFLFLRFFFLKGEMAKGDRYVEYTEDTVKAELWFVSPSPQQQATMEPTTLLRLKTEQEKMGRDERRQKDAAQAIIELAKQKREEAQKPRGHTLQDNTRLQMD